MGPLSIHVYNDSEIELDNVQMLTVTDEHVILNFNGYKNDEQPVETKSNLTIIESVKENAIVV